MNEKKAGTSEQRKTAAFLFAIVAICALAVSAYYGRQRDLRENPPPLPNVIAPLPPEQLQAIRIGLPIVRKTILHTTPEQDAKWDELWKNPPRSLTEVIEYERRTNEILTTAQLGLYRPMRKKFQHRVVDAMLKPAGDRLSDDDFQKLKDEVKKRVDERIDGK